MLHSDVQPGDFFVRFREPSVYRVQRGRFAGKRVARASLGEAGPALPSALAYMADRKPISDQPGGVVSADDHEHR